MDSHDVLRYPPSEGWTKYYSAEGYPYYYNAITAISEWAPVEDKEAAEHNEVVDSEESDKDNSEEDEVMLVT
jgi:hypothetical protein